MNEEIKNIVSDEIINTYESIRNFLFKDQKRLEELAKIEGREEVKDAISGATTSVAKCLLDVLSFGLASSLLEATSGLLESIKGSSNETERLLAAYDKIAKKYNRQNRTEIKKGTKIKLQTSDEMLDDIYKDSGMNRRQFRLLKNIITKNFMSISLMKHKQKVDMLEGKLLGFEGRLQALEKQIQQQKVEEAHAQNLSDKFKGLERLKLSEANDVEGEQIHTPHATGTSNDVTTKSQVVENRLEEDSEIEDDRAGDTGDIKEEDKGAKTKQFQNLPNGLKNVERLKLPGINNKEKNLIQAQLTSQSLDSGIAYLQDEGKRVNSARKEIEEKTHQNDLASRSMPC